MPSNQHFGLQRLSAFLKVFQKDSPYSKSIQSQSTLLDIWRQSVNGPLKNTCIPISYENGILSVHIHSQGWAQKLRFEQKSIKARLQTHPDFNQLQSIKIRIQPAPASLPRRRDKNTSQPAISRSTAKLLVDVADSVSDDHLADALRRIASRNR